ncbi:ferritin-like domain-containing protein [Magnetospirillum sulfuroxidans]|uniref:Ferritin family protein n=1 Tax=Magnetospirillum sulfuroxidans TaxID=611300 RepID=A0ABS5IAT9_9PROT|nr:ferritin family protein [Magnetospirillum sulfuroxidans]MBR9971540.1 ferritin family protein [Magnetospirillum sulfuroxidans]
MKSVEEFLVYAARLEQEAALRFDELADAAGSFDNTEVSGFFRQMAEYSRMHLEEARKRGGFRDLPDMAPGDYDWPQLESPEAAAIWAADPQMDVAMALSVALDAETNGLAFYQGVLDRTSDPEIKAMAAEFVEEEAEHVAAIQRWIARSAA